MSDTALHYRLLAAGDRLGEWRLVGRLHDDPAGEVWQARHHTLDRDARVTIATDPAQAAVLQATGQAHARVSDSRVARTLGLALDHQPPYLVQAHVPGESLRDVLARGPLPWGQALAITREMLAALVSAHGVRVVHGALRPECVTLPAAGGLCLHGFGSPLRATASPDAVVISDVLDPEGLRRARDLEYVAPELRAGGAPTVGGDLFAVGVIGHELCTGELPIGPASAHDRRPEVPAALAGVWQRARGRAESRFPTAAAVLAALPAPGAPAGRLRIAPPEAPLPPTGIVFGDGQVQCPACRHENPLAHRFCVRCGRALHAGTSPARACARCRTTAPAHHRFCPRCGAALPE